MDFSKLNAQELAEKGCVKSDFIGLDLKPLDGVSVTILGELSKRGQEIKSAINRVIDGGKKNLSLEERNTKVNTELIVGLVTEWSGVIWEGKELGCTEENKRKIFECKGFEWFTGQVLYAIRDTRNFLSKADKGY